nr:MAG TPA: Transcriptional adapter [Caudoviricetes sp.]
MCKRTNPAPDDYIKIKARITLSKRTDLYKQ